MFNRRYFEDRTDVKELFRSYGSFGELSGELQHEGSTAVAENSAYRMVCTWNRDENGVICRQDTFTNRSDAPINVRCLKSRFIFEGGEYDVYTQFNTWQNESTGSWQKLVTNVSVSGASSRTTQDGTPFLVLWNRQENRGAAFHLLPDSAWEIKVTRVGHYCKYTKIVVELGISDYNFDVTLAPGETFALPEILCYEVRSKLDMDCWKLHNYMHTHYPRRQLPIIFNTWLYRFDNITYENLSKQIPLAANLGVEYFVIDAGWFGKGAGWGESIGDWSENTESRLCGRMIDIANEVRAHGMKFGLWLEPERAMPTSDAVAQHPEFYLDGDAEPEYKFLDFANPDARSWMLGVISDLIRHYGIEYIKDDYNADMYFDTKHTAFRAYHEGHEIFMRELRKAFPNCYLSSCASGGERMELSNYRMFDSTWPSDNESPYTEMRIYRDSILRLPPQTMERWVSAHSLGGFEDFYQSFAGSNGTSERLVACGDAIWKKVEGVQQSFLRGYMTAGPIGFSCDLSLLSETAYEEFRKFVAGVKQYRDFWRTCVARILCDTENVTEFQYSDAALSRVVVQLFTRHTQQDHFRIFPILAADKSYRINGGEVLTAREIMDEGIALATGVWVDNWDEMLEVILEEV